MTVQVRKYILLGESYLALICLLDLVLNYICRVLLQELVSDAFACLGRFLLLRLLIFFGAGRLDAVRVVNGSFLRKNNAVVVCFVCEVLIIAIYVENELLLILRGVQMPFFWWRFVFCRGWNFLDVRRNVFKLSDILILSGLLLLITRLLPWRSSASLFDGGLLIWLLKLLILLNLVWFSLFNQVIDDIFIILQFIEFFLLKVNRNRLVVSLIVVKKISRILLTTILIGHYWMPDIKWPRTWATKQRIVVQSIQWILDDTWSWRDNIIWVWKDFWLLGRVMLILVLN